MQRYTNVAQDALGNIIQGMSVSVFLQGTQTLATIYSDNGITVKPNPTITDALGTFFFYAANAHYDLQLTKTGLPTTQLLDILLFDVASSVSTISQTLDSIAALKALAAPAGSVTCLVRGFATAGDGGGGFYWWNAADARADDGGTIIQLNVGGVGRFNKLF